MGDAAEAETEAVIDSHSNIRRQEEAIIIIILLHTCIVLRCVGGSERWTEQHHKLLPLREFDPLRLISLALSPASRRRSVPR